MGSHQEMEHQEMEDEELAYEVWSGSGTKRGHKADMGDGMACRMKGATCKGIGRDALTDSTAAG